MQSDPKCLLNMSVKRMPLKVRLFNVHSVEEILLGSNLQNLSIGSKNPM